MDNIKKPATSARAISVLNNASFQKLSCGVNGSTHNERDHQYGNAQKAIQNRVKQRMRTVPKFALQLVLIMEK